MLDERVPWVEGELFDVIGDALGGGGVAVVGLDGQARDGDEGRDRFVPADAGVLDRRVLVVDALSAEAAEKDLRDLTDIRVMGRPPEFTADNQVRYDDLVKQGERYETLSWVAFGAAGAAFATATVLFLTSRSDDSPEQPPVSIQVTGNGAAITGTFGF